MEFNETVKTLCNGDGIVIFSNQILHQNEPIQLLPEKGIFEEIIFSECAKYPIWISIKQERGEKTVTMTFALEKIESIIVNDMTPEETAKILEPGQRVNITTTFRNSSFKNKSYLGEFVSYEPKGMTYKLTIKVPTDFIGITGKSHAEEKLFWGHTIQKITIY